MIFFFFFAMLCVLPGGPAMPAAPNSSVFEFSPQNSDYVELFLPYLHKGWWHLWVLLHKEEVLVTAVAMGALHCQPPLTPVLSQKLLDHVLRATKLDLCCCTSRGEIEPGFAAPRLLIISPVAEQGGLMGFPTSRW